MFFPSHSQTTGIPLKRMRSGQPRRTWTSAAWSSSPRRCYRQGFCLPSLRRGRGGGGGGRRRSRSKSFFDPFVDYSRSRIRIVLQQAMLHRAIYRDLLPTGKTALHVNRHAICQIELMEGCLWVEFSFHHGALIVGHACHLSKFNHKGFFAIVFVQKRIQSRAPWLGGGVVTKRYFSLGRHFCISWRIYLGTKGRW